MFSVQYVIDMYDDTVSSCSNCVVCQLVKYTPSSQWQVGF
jgi:hypothetical protein